LRWNRRGREGGREGGREREGGGKGGREGEGEGRGRSFFSCSFCIFQKNKNKKNFHFILQLQRPFPSKM